MTKQVRISLAVLVPIALILCGVLVASQLYGWFKEKDASIQPDETYAIWISEVHVSDRHADGRMWDRDESGPDLKGEIYWRDIKILETDEKSDSLVARWDSANVDIRAMLLKGRVGADQMNNVGLIKPGEEDHLSVKFYDSDLVDDELIGGATWAATGMVEGVNVFRLGQSSGEIQSFHISVVPVIADAGLAVAQSAQSSSATTGADWIMPGAGSAESKAEEYSAMLDQGASKGATYMKDKLSETARKLKDQFSSPDQGVDKDE